jgi:hypothetical protein
MTNKKNLYGKVVDDIYILQWPEYILYDLKVEIIYKKEFIWKNTPQQEYFRKKEWHFFELIGENIYIPDWQPFSIYDFSVVLPLLAAKQRVTHQQDRITTDSEISVPDPYCPYRLRITRIWKRVFSHEETSDVSTS